MDDASPPIADFPPLAELLPHTGPMILLDRVVSHDATHTACEVRLGDATLFRGADGRVPAFVAIEYMAQCIGAHAGLTLRGAGRPVRIGFLLGTRGMALHVEAFEAGAHLLVRATHGWGSDEMVSFECGVHEAASGRALAEATLTCYQPEDAHAALLKGPHA